MTPQQLENVLTAIPITTAHDHETVTVEVVHDTLDWPALPVHRSASDRVGVEFVSGTDDPEELLTGCEPRRESSFLFDPDQAIALAHKLLIAAISVAPDEPDRRTQR
jgi:hypothetical protein